MPAEDLAPCGHGAFGQCCCECGHLAIAKEPCHHLGGPYPCGKNEDGILGLLARAAKAAEHERYACTVFFVLEAGPIELKHSQHGCCELWTERKIHLWDYATRRPKIDEAGK